MKPATETCEWDIPTRSHMLTCTHSSQLTRSHVYSHMGSHTPAHTCTLQTCSDTCSHTHGFHTCSDVGSHVCSHVLSTHAHIYPYTHLLTQALHTSSHTHSCTGTTTRALSHTHTHTLTQHMQTHIDPSDTPETPIPDGDHIPTVTLDVPAAVGAWGVVEGPGRAVDDTAPFCVLLQFPTAGSCQERRLRSTGLTFG